MKIQNLQPPKQYQQGWTEFYKLKFKLTSDVLIPRPETELLVEEVLNYNPKTILDLGTGSGCIAISIAKNSPQSKIIATDVSEKALNIAKQNAKLHRVEGQIIFLKSNLLEFISEKAKAPDVIVANLPYIPTHRLLLIDPMVTEFEPKVALDGGLDGFELYRKLFSQMKEKNFIPKILLIEIDSSHSDLAIREAHKFFPNSKASIKKDLTYSDRILMIKLTDDKAASISSAT